MSKSNKWSAVSIPIELKELAERYYEEHEEELKLKLRVRSFSAFITYLITEGLKQLGALEVK